MEDFRYTTTWTVKFGCVVRLVPMQISAQYLLVQILTNFKLFLMLSNDFDDDLKGLKTYEANFLLHIYHPQNQQNNLHQYIVENPKWFMKTTLTINAVHVNAQSVIELGLEDFLGI